MRHLLEFLKLSTVPPLSRPNYAAELRHAVSWGLFANLVDGSFSSIVVAKTFHGSALLVSIVWATPMLAHVLTFLWGVAIRGRPKIRTYVLLALCSVASAASIALTPATALGGWIFAAQIAATRIFMSGLVTVRTSIWKSNYPPSHRARIAGRLQALNALLFIGIGTCASLLFDRHAEYFRSVYPAAAIIGALSLAPLRGLRIRGEARELEAYRAAGRRSGNGWRDFRRGVGEAVTILRTDHHFARYCTAQYLLGSANLMTDPVLTVYLTKNLALSYFHAYLLMDLIPTIVSLLTIPWWAHLFDRVGVIRFRVVNSLYWLGSIALVTLALVVSQARCGLPLAVGLGLFVVARIVNGMGRGGGTIAWYIGHLHFARPHDADLYMGIHIALTGFRGMLMPFVGTYFYGLIGPWILLLGVGLMVGGWQAFRRLDILEGRRVQHAAPDAVAEAVQDSAIVSGESGGT